MRLENTFEVSRPPAEAWDIIMDVRRIVACVPGAELVSIEEDGSYKGTVGVKLGPVALKFQGNVRIVDADPHARTASVIARGSDQKGRGNAGATTKISILAAGSGSRVHLDTDLQLSGMVAQYGRATGMIAALSNEIISQFAAALSAQLAGYEAAAKTPGAAAKPGAASEQPFPRATAVAKAPALGFGTIWRAFLAWVRGKMIVGRPGGRDTRG